MTELYKKKENNKNFFDEILNFIKNESIIHTILKIVIIICIAYIISKFISIFNVHVNFSF